MAIRFHVVVFNFERISSFLDNFDKIHNFRPDRDRLIVFDCSVDHASQTRLAADFADQRGWTLGKELEVVRRRIFIRVGPDEVPCFVYFKLCFGGIPGSVAFFIDVDVSGLLPRTIEFL